MHIWQMLHLWKRFARCRTCLQEPYSAVSLIANIALDPEQHLLLMQADYALSRLVTLKDRTEATESLAKMHLAQRRNELVSFDLMLTVISTNVSFFGGVAAICGMNLWLAGSGAPKARHVALMLYLIL